MAIWTKARRGGGEEPMAMADDGLSTRCATSAQDAVAASAKGRGGMPSGLGAVIGWEGRRVTIVRVDMWLSDFHGKTRAVAIAPCRQHLSLAVVAHVPLHLHPPLCRLLTPPPRRLADTASSTTRAQLQQRARTPPRASGGQCAKELLTLFASGGTVVALIIALIASFALFVCGSLILCYAGVTGIGAALCSDIFSATGMTMTMALGVTFPVTAPGIKILIFGSMPDDVIMVAACACAEVLRAVDAAGSGLLLGLGRGHGQ